MLRYNYATEIESRSGALTPSGVAPRRVRSAMQVNHNPLKTKCCIRCGTEKSESEFFMRPGTDGRRRAHCKACHHEGRSPDGPWHARIVGLRQRGHAVAVAALRETLGEPKVCYLCGGALDWDSAWIDHVIPVSKGGTNDPDNLRWAHPDCNRMKGDLALIDALGLMQKILARYGEFDKISARDWLPGGWDAGEGG